MASKAKSTVSISIITALSRITGLLRITALSAVLGQTISIAADSYNIANTLPNMVYELILGGVLTSVFIPVFVESKSQKTEQEAWDVANRIITIAILILSIMTVICWLFTPFLVRLQSLESTSPEKLKLANFFFYFFAPQIIFYGLYAIFSSILNTYNRFVMPAAVSIFNNIIVITTIILFHYYPQQFGFIGLAIGTTLGVALMSIIMLPQLFKLGWRFHWKLDFTDPMIKKLYVLSIPMVIYVGFNQVALTVRNNFANAWGIGGFSAMQNAFYFFMLPYGIFSVSIMTVLYPALSKQAVDEDMVKFRKTISQGIRWSALVIIPCTVGYLFLSKPIIQIALQHGEFRNIDTTLAASLLAAYSFALLPYTLTLLFTRSFYALQDTKTPLLVVIVGVILTTVGCYATYKPFGIQGVAIAYGMQYWGMAILFWFLLRKKIQRFEGRRIVTAFGKSIIASTIMGAALYFIYNDFLLQWTQSLGQQIRPFFANAIGLFLAVTLGAVIYFIMVWVMKMEEVTAIWNALRRRKAEV